MGMGMNHPQFPRALGSFPLVYLNCGDEQMFIEFLLVIESS